MSLLHVIALGFFCICVHQINCEEITFYRGQCRRDTLFKKFRENKKLTGSSNVIPLTVKSLAYCVRDCLRTVSCLSVNFKRFATVNEMNCELLDINDSNPSAIVSDASGWNIYKPVTQVLLCLFHSKFSSFN